MYELFLNVG